MYQIKFTNEWKSVKKNNQSFNSSALCLPPSLHTTGLYGVVFISIPAFHTSTAIVSIYMSRGKRGHRCSLQADM